MKLYHYVHCPFCVRVRMVLGLLNLQYESIVVAYNDESTPIKLTGKKMLPILVDDLGVPMNESLDIIASLDTSKTLNWPLLEKNRETIEQLLNELGTDVHSLCMPYWIWTPEFNQDSRRYFQIKKEVKRGPFKNLVKEKDKFIKSLDNTLATQIRPHLRPYYQSNKLTILDIMIASHLWGMYIYPEYQFPTEIHEYLQRVKNDCRFDYHHDFWQ